MINWNIDNIHKLRTMLEDGRTLQECGDFFGISKQGIRNVLSKYLPNVKPKSMQKKREAKQAQKEERRQELLRTLGRETLKCEDDLQRAQSRIFTQKKSNAKNQVEFTVKMTDLVWPTHCPVLGIELDWLGRGRQKDASPSFDRIDPSRGYVPGNVMIISMRANRIKNDGTADEHEKIAHWIRGLQEDKRGL